MHLKNKLILDNDQTFWQLALIQTSSLGLGIIVVGAELAEKYGQGTAFTSILIGNLIWWSIGLAIIGMSFDRRKNAIQTISNYLGRSGAVLASIIVVGAFLIWFSLQIQFAVTTIGPLSPVISEKIPDISLRIGAALGLFISLISIGGIRIIKWICIIAAPFLFFYCLYFSFNFGVIKSPITSWIPSFSAIVTTLSVILPGIVNIPTFFRHSKSKNHSILGLSLMLIFVVCFQLMGVAFDFSTQMSVVLAKLHPQHVYLYSICVTAFIIISLVCVNLVNIYFASAGWELILPKRIGPKEYTIAGLVGTAIYTFIQAPIPMLFLETLMTDWITNLSVVLLIDFLIKSIVTHRIRPFEQFISFLCWVISGIVSIITLIKYSENETLSMITGICTVLILFLVILLFEETAWSINSIWHNRKKDN